MKITKLYLFIFAGLLIFLSSSAYLLRDAKVNSKSYNAYDNSRLIKFDHKLHVKDAGVKCEDCHTGAPGSVSAKDNLNPQKAVCAACHDVKDEKKCNLCHYDGVYKKLKAVKSELMFSHKQHIETEKKACLDCHKGLDNVKFSKEAGLTMLPNMENCASCHDNKKASLNCEGCHTNLTNLKPGNHLQPNFLNEHRTVSDVSSEKNNCMMCHSDNFCQACHSPVNFQGNNTKEDFYAPYYTKENGTRTDRAALQKISNAHDLGYRNTHGLDAQSRAYECKSCHETQSFCAACHMDGGEMITGFAPKSHLQAGFTTMGVNTGGGLHSALAKKDIESCMSCHDVQGGDPVCITCHFDNDGVKGTNPRTHESGFMSDEKGIWHDTQGAICYTCHTDANAKPTGINGVGFCGYCHTATINDRRGLK